MSTIPLFRAIFVLENRQLSSYEIIRNKYERHSVIVLRIFSRENRSTHFEDGSVSLCVVL